MRQQSHRINPGRVDMHFRVIEATRNGVLRAFTKIVASNFRKKCFSVCSTQERKKKFLDLIERRGFKEYFGSLDYQYFT